MQLLKGESAVDLGLVELPCKRERSALTEGAREAGVGIYSVAPYFLGQAPGEGLLIGYANLSEHEIEEGIRALTAVIEKQRGASEARGVRER